MARPDVLRIENGEKAKATFSQSEYDRRQSALRAHMADAGIDAVLFTSIHNVNYYSDFLYCAFGRPYGLVVTQSEVVSISANIDAGQPWRRTVGDYNLVYTDWQRDNYLRAVQQVVPNRGRLGIEFDHITHERLTALQVGGAAVVAALAEGVPEHEVALASTQAMVREIARRFPHAELMDTWTWFQSGINTDGAHNPVTTRAVQRGDILSLNCFSMIAGYYTALERTSRQSSTLSTRSMACSTTARSAMATALVCCATTMAARPDSSCAKTSTPSLSRIWWCRWSRWSCCLTACPERAVTESTTFLLSPKPVRATSRASRSDPSTISSREPPSAVCH